MNRLVMTSLILSTLVVCFMANAKPPLSRHELKAKAIKLLEGDQRPIGIDKDNPHYPALVIAKSAYDGGVKSPQKVVQMLEEMLTQSNFKGNIASHKFLVGTVGGHSVWRDALYVILGRAYYESMDFEKAVYYYTGVPITSYMASLAFIEKGWALLKLNKLQEADKNLALIRDDLRKSLKGDLFREFQIQRMFFLVRSRKYDEALSLNKKIKKINNGVLKSLKHKIVAQAYFDKYLAKADQSDFKRKIFLLKKIIDNAQLVKNDHRDAEFSFLSSEAYWHMASTLRVEDPINSKDKVNSLLKIADKWISPFINKSIKQKKAFITEEAMFFSIALQWEREEFRDAVLRLKNLPLLFPQGEYLEDTYQLLGDYYFERSQFKKAISNYKKLSIYADEQKAAYGVYKAAWSFFNLNQKWKALRHFERLMMFYQNQKKVHGTSYVKFDKIGLIDESKRDFISAMAEIMKYDEALKELKIFGFTPSEMLDYESKLAKNYQKIGKFSNAVSTYKYLLKRYPKHKDNLTWLKELLSTHLSAGARKRIANDLNRHYPIVKKNGDYPKKVYNEFQKSLASIILTVHKEARKTDDINIWMAIDSLYKAYMRHFKDSNDGDIWYFGAQRQERLKRPWDAVEWYKKAAMVKGYEGLEDASLSVLRIIRKISEEGSLSKKRIKKYKKDFLKIASAAKWYQDTFPKTKQSKLAQFLYLDALYFAGQFDKSNRYIGQIFNARGDTPKNWELYLAHNQKYYRAKKWRQSNLLSKLILDSSKKLSSKNKNFLTGLYQETAFLEAQKLEKNAKGKKSRKQRGEIKKWYKNAISVSSDPIRQIKAWANLIYNHDSKKDLASFEKVVGDFESFYAKKSALKKKHKAFFFDIYAFIAKSYESTKDDYKKANFLVKAAPWSSTDKAKEELIWEAIVLYGTYQDFSRMEKWKEVLEKKKSSQILKDNSNRVTLGRLYYYGGKYALAWNTLFPLLKGNQQIPPSAWILFGDLYRVSLSQNEKLAKIMAKFMLKRSGELKLNTVVRPLWSYIYYNEFLQKTKLWEGKKKTLTPSDIQVKNVIQYANKSAKKKMAKISRSDLAFYRLKMRLEDVGRIIKTMNEVKKDMNLFIVEWRPQLSAKALCLAQKQTQAGIMNLMSIREKPIRGKQWKDFLKKLNGKINELIKVSKRELKTCSEFKETLAFMAPLEHSSSPLCHYGECFAPKEVDKVALSLLDQNNLHKRNIDKLWDHLSKGAYSKAHLLAGNVKDSDERSLLLGLIRLSLNDTWNAYPLFEKAAKNKKFKKDAEFYMTMTELRHGHYSKAVKKLKKFKSRSLASWQRPYLKKMVQDYNKNRD